VSAVEVAILHELCRIDELDDLDDNGFSTSIVEVAMQKKLERDRPVGRAEVLLRPETLGLIPAKNADALAQAFVRAELNKIEMLRRPEMVNGEVLAQELGVSRATVDNRRVAGQLLALEFPSKRGFRYPLWQRDLILNDKSRGLFEAALERLAGLGPWSRYRFFTQNAPALAGQSPLQELAAGRGEAVLRAADSWVQGEQGGG
jgi:HTH domain